MHQSYFSSMRIFSFFIFGYVWPFSTCVWLFMVTYDLCMAMYDYVCMAMNVWLCMYEFICMAIHVWLFMFVYIYMFIYLCIYVNVSMYAQKYSIHTYMNMDVPARNTKKDSIMKHPSSFMFVIFLQFLSFFMYSVVSK